MNRWLWVVQVVFGIYFIVIGILHFVLPDGLPGPMEWMYDLSPTLHAITGVAEILGGLGLILPGVTGIAPQLTPAAAAGLSALMIGAAIWHIPRGEITNVILTLVLAVVMGYVAYARTRLSPLPERAAA